MGATPVADGVEHSATVELADDVAPCGLAFQLLDNGQVVAGARAPSPTVMRCPLGYYPGTPQPLGFSFQVSCTQPPLWHPHLPSSSYQASR